MTPAEAVIEKPANVRAGTNGKRVSMPKYVRLANELRRRMKVGELVPGQQLPSFATMQAEHGVAQATLEQVYQLLERDGLILRTRGRGTFVATPRPRPATGVVGVLTKGLSHQHPYYAVALQAIQSAAQNLNLSVLLLSDPALLDSARVDGLITYHLDDDMLRKLPPGVPRVSIIFAESRMGNVVADDYRGSRDATEYLLALGHRRISFLTSGCQKDADVMSRQRLLGYYDALKAAGVEASPHWVRSLYGPWTPRHDDDFRQNGYNQLVQWLREGWMELGCTALMAQNDDVAVGAIEALEEAGLRVPLDVSVVGFDGQQIADYFRPRLTTVVVPLREIGKSAVERLGRLIEHPLHGVEANGGSHADIVLPAPLRIGDSTAPPRQDM